MMMASKVAKQRPLLVQTKRLLRQFDLKAKKGLGQHFLVDESVLKLIVSAAELTPSDVVVEIGPGLGILTRELASEAGWVIAVEMDSKLAEVLKETMAPFDNVAIASADILSLSPSDLFQEQSTGFSRTTRGLIRYKVVANLPYYIASAVLRHFLSASLKPQTLVVMVQKEVAEAIVARPGRMSLLSVGVQFYGEPSIVSCVPAECFYPAPEVDSAILRIDVYPEPAVSVTDEQSFFELVRAGFSASRKQLANSLAQGLGSSKIEVMPLLEEADIVSQRRAETLSLDEWVRLWQVYTLRQKLAG